MISDEIKVAGYDLCAMIQALPLPEQIEALNAVRAALHNCGPFAAEPVDFVRWVPGETVEANEYNPNSVAPPEMELLRLSIEADGYTQPIVSHPSNGGYEVVDGFHRNRVGKECAEVAEKLHGYLPIVEIKHAQSGIDDRMASTIRHNRARGKHKISSMSDIVIELKRRNWSDEKIGKQLGMDPDEVLRLTQIAGIAEAFADHQFSEAWEAVPEEYEDTEEIA